MPRTTNATTPRQRTLDQANVTLLRQAWYLAQAALLGSPTPQHARLRVARNLAARQADPTQVTPAVVAGVALGMLDHNLAQPLAPCPTSLRGTKCQAPHCRTNAAGVTWVGSSPMAYCLVHAARKLVYSYHVDGKGWGWCPLPGAMGPGTPA